MNFKLNKYIKYEFFFATIICLFLFLKREISHSSIPVIYCVKSVFSWFIDDMPFNTWAIECLQKVGPETCHVPGQNWFFLKVTFSVFRNLFLLLKVIFVVVEQNAFLSAAAWLYSLSAFKIFFLFFISKSYNIFFLLFW